VKVRSGSSCAIWEGSGIGLFWDVIKTVIKLQYGMRGSSCLCVHLFLRKSYWASLTFESGPCLGSVSDVFFVFFFKQKTELFDFRTESSDFISWMSPQKLSPAHQTHDKVQIRFFLLLFCLKCLLKQVHGVVVCGYIVSKTDHCNEGSLHCTFVLQSFSSSCCKSYI